MVSLGSLEYRDYAYLWPPRPETKSPPGMIPFYQRMGWQAQVKKNGSCTLVFVRADDVIFKTRHNDDHRQWAPSPEHKRFFANGRSDWDVYVGELLHSKINPADTKSCVRNHLYLFDIIVDRGYQLVGTTFAARQQILQSRWEKLEDGFDHSVVHKSAPLPGAPSQPLVSVAKTFTGGFTELWKRINEMNGAKRVRPEDEGLVFKDPKAALRACFKGDSNSGWQAKIRVPHKNYPF